MFSAVSMAAYWRLEWPSVSLWAAPFLQVLLSVPWCVSRCWARIWGWVNEHLFVTCSRCWESTGWWNKPILASCRGGGGLVAKSCPTLVTPWTVARQAPLSMGFSGQEYWSGLPFPSPGDLPNLGIESGSPAWQANSLPTELLGKPTSYHTADKSSSITRVT